MIKELKIENYAIIDNLQIDLSAGLNTITGETGAGKSILLGALELLSGGRAESSAFAQNSRNCVVEATFSYDYPSDEILAQNDIEAPEQSGSELIIRRVISPEGRSRAFINDQPVSLTLLRELSSTLIDIHSQHQTLLLARNDYQISILDTLGSHNLDHYRRGYKTLREIEKEHRTIVQQAQESKRRAEYLHYQIDQIDQAQINPEEIAQKEARVQMLDNATEIAQNLALAHTALNSEESGVVDALRSSQQALERVKKSYPPGEEFANRLGSLYLEAKDIAAEIENAAEKIEINPTELSTLREQLDTVYALMHKHSVETPQELLELNAQMEEELNGITDIEDRITQIETTISTLTAELTTQAKAIDQGRRAVAPMVEQEIVCTLKELGITHAQFVVEIGTTDQLTPTGCNTVKMYFSANPGKAPQPIENVASGGEMSRVMLAIKGLVSRSSQLQTIVFDEIDTGVSGIVAHKMGEIIVGMSSNMQVLNITHLPQVASKGKSHFLVYKDPQGTHIKKLTPEQRIDHIAQMLSGSEVTPAALAQAQELLSL